MKQTVILPDALGVAIQQAYLAKGKSTHGAMQETLARGAELALAELRNGSLEKHISEILPATDKSGDKLLKSPAVVTAKEKEFLTEWKVAVDALARIMQSGDKEVINAILSNLAVFSRVIAAKATNHERSGDVIPTADSASLDERVKKINLATEQVARKSSGIVEDIKGERDDIRRGRRGNQDDRGKTGSGGGN